jgi:hypothetical protein
MSEIKKVVKVEYQIKFTNNLKKESVKQMLWVCYIRSKRHRDEYRTENFDKEMSVLQIRNSLSFVSTQRQKRGLHSGGTQLYSCGTMRCGLGSTRPKVLQRSLPPRNLIGIFDPEELQPMNFSAQLDLGIVTFKFSR